MLSLMAQGQLGKLAIFACKTIPDSFHQKMVQAKFLLAVTGVPLEGLKTPPPDLSTPVTLTDLRYFGHVFSQPSEPLYPNRQNLRQKHILDEFFVCVEMK